MGLSILHFKIAAPKEACIFVGFEVTYANYNILGVKNAAIVPTPFEVSSCTSLRGKHAFHSQVNVINCCLFKPADILAFVLRNSQKCPLKLLFRNKSYSGSSLFYVGWK
jgi:hypothetical protein